jgi:hypothetical protein
MRLVDAIFVSAQAVAWQYWLAVFVDWRDMIDIEEPVPNDALALIRHD